MAEKCYPLTTITTKTTSNEDVVHALTFHNTTCLVDDQTSKADVDASANKSDVKKPKARRGKIKMEKMEKENNLLVTFSKRKSGLIKKANELCTMCGVQCALVIFSPANKVFSFGHPSVEQVVEWYLSGNPNPIFAKQEEIGNQVMPLGSVIQDLYQENAANTGELMGEMRELEAVLEAAKNHGKEMDERRVARMASHWWERPLQELNGHQIETIKQAMVDLKSKVFDMAKLRYMPLAQDSSSSPYLPLGLGINYPKFHGAGLRAAYSFGGFPRWNNNSHGPDEAGPSGHATGGWSGGSGSGSFGDGVVGGNGLF